MNLLAVINPVSGGTDKAVFLDYLDENCKQYGISTHVFKTTGEKDLEKLKAEIDRLKPDKIMAAGGDGTFALCALASMGSQIPVGIVPLGSANGMAKELGVKSDPEQAFDAFVKSQLHKPMDVILINSEHHCFHLGDAGFNARVVKDYDNDENRGMLVYGKHASTHYGNLEPFKYTIEANGRTYQGKCSMLAFGNGRKYGTGIPINTEGNPFDGKFEIVTVVDLDFKTALKAGLSLISEYFTESNFDETISTDKAVIRFESKELVQSDGEVLGEFETLTLEMKAGAFVLLTDGENPYL
jgi:diacylglycerol kinase (ATP)